MRRRPSPAFAAPSGEPISELNTTPLIDVMLVLLIMFIITIPIATHKVPLTLPGEVPPPIPTEPVVHLLDMDVAGRVYWNGVLTPETRLPGLLAEMRASGPLAVLHFRADGETRYEDFDRVLATVKRAGIERMGLIGNERFAGAALR
jgi:biopolymer transport protein ExbD